MWWTSPLSMLVRIGSSGALLQWGLQIHTTSWLAVGLLAILTFQPQCVRAGPFLTSTMRTMGRGASSGR